MIINISNQESSIIENGVYYFSPQKYPHLSDLELKNLLDFFAYEKLYGRQTEIVCESADVLIAVNNAVAHPETVADTLLPAKITGCTDCLHHGCFTEFVYHGTDLQAAQQILSGGRLLSAVKAYGKSGDALAYEKRDSPWNDPPDFFEYIMFCWGSCIVGGYVIMSDSSGACFNPGVRFYFRYADLLRHPGHVFDGYHPIKVKDKILLYGYLYACIAPEQYKEDLENHVPPELAAKVHYLPQNGLGISEWSERVYEFVSKL